MALPWQDRALAYFFLFALWGNVTVDVFMGLDIDLRDNSFWFLKGAWCLVLGAVSERLLAFALLILGPASPFM